MGGKGRDSAATASADARVTRQRQDQSSSASAAGGRPPRSGGAAAACAPRVVTTGGKAAPSAIVDWLNATFHHECGPDQVVSELSTAMGGATVLWFPNEGGGLHGFEHGVRLKVYASCELRDIGWFCWGGESQRGRALLNVTGAGCSLVQDWQHVHDWLAELSGIRLTRVDLAVDLLDGDYDLDDAASWALEGRFNNGGNAPELDQQGDWLTRKHGRTLYVGQAKNGKMLRCYEKGKQLGDLDSPWVRFEVQFGSRDRELPLRMLIERDAFFAGAYPALSEVLAVLGERIRTIREETKVTISHAVEHLSRTYGAWIHTLAQSGIDPADLVEQVRVRAVPRRLKVGSLADPGYATTVQEALYERALQ